MYGITNLMSSTGIGIQDDKELERVNWRTVQKIIISLYRNGMMRRTMIAMRCRLRYDKCRSHLDWCESLKLIKTKKDEDGSELMVLTDRGMEIYREQLAHKQIDV